MQNSPATSVLHMAQHEQHTVACAFVFIEVLLLFEARAGVKDQSHWAHRIGPDPQNIAHLVCPFTAPSLAAADIRCTGCLLPSLRGSNWISGFARAIAVRCASLIAPER
jgi:hypothetical protein